VLQRRKMTGRDSTRRLQQLCRIAGVLGFARAIRRDALTR
jgi:hypothetical protein